VSDCRANDELIGCGLAGLWALTGPMPNDLFHEYWPIAHRSR